VSGNVSGEARGISGVAIFQAEGINHFHAGGAGKVEKLINVLFLGNRDGWVVNGIGANTEAFDAEGLEGLDESVVAGVEIIFSVLGQEHGRLVAQAEKAGGELGVGAVGGNSDGHRLGLG
jgi:hypothetical protein